MSALASQLATAAPSLTPTTTHLRIGSSMVMWGPQGAAALHPVTTLMVPFLDGSAPLGDLFEDAVAALGLDEATCVEPVESDLINLERISAIRERTPETARSAAPEPSAEGFSRTVVVTLDSTGAGQLPELLGTASLTDLVEADNCVGQRLRAGLPATELHVSVEGAPVRVRSDHPGVTAELQQRLVAHLVDQVEEPGPIVAYVVAPWEGRGPARVYDRWSRRVGRPRSVVEVADAVGVLLSEWSDPPGDGGVTVHATTVEDGSGGCVLIDERLGTAPRFHRSVRDRGWTVRPNRRVVIDRRGAVVVEGPFPEGHLSYRTLAGVVIGEPEGTEPIAAAMAALLNGIAAATPGDALEALHLLAGVLIHAPVVASGRDAHSLVHACESLLRPAPIPRG